ncbi:MAG: lipoyl(octanoyl) transferase [Chloroflexi bacterium]|jgi:lipoate-protein ligase B|nr:MAG: lipoyl(octanoyl) transferase [Chloroflexota bacterium]
MTNLEYTVSGGWRFLGRMDYLEAWNLQTNLARSRISGEISDTVLFVEHPPTYTLGRRGTDVDLLLPTENLEALGANVVEVDRGGQATFHGPGQLVVYPIIDLRQWGSGPVKYVRTLESILICVLEKYGIKGGLLDGLTGVWVDEEKIAAIGVKISRGVTMHGFALNISTDLSWFDHIVPCGVRDKGVTSMEELLGDKINVEDVISTMLTQFALIMGLSLDLIRQ